METSIMWAEYPSSISEITEKNSSFDSCELRVCYTGDNRNGTSISRKAIENAIPTIYYCPIVCNYDIDTDEIGGHDVDIVNGDSGLRLVNLTDPVGVIPEGASYHWETIDDNGTEHEYFCIEGLLWKRSAAYDKIKRDGITAQSMEITINDGKRVDDVYQILDFDFTAFCLLGDGVQPCFESASMKTFSVEVGKERFARMMEDFKAEYNVVIPAKAVDKKITKGGRKTVDELLATYGLSSADLNFDTNGMSREEIEKRLAEIAKAKFDDGGETDEDEGAAEETADDGQEQEPEEGDPQPEPQSGVPTNEPEEEQPEGGAPDDDDKKKAYSLTEAQLADELENIVGSADKYHDIYWDEDIYRYIYVDHDCGLGQVYFRDRAENYNLYGAPFVMNGDTPVVDFASKTRKKIVYEDWESTDVIDGGSAVFARLEEQSKKKFSELKAELDELQKFKKQKEDEQRAGDEEALFSKFADLDGNADFEALRGNCAQYTLEQLEEKCFAIRGRSVTVNFSVNNTHDPIRLPVDGSAGKRDDEPYGGLFLRYGFGERK